MNLISKIRNKLLGKPVTTASEQAYDLWASGYDDQPDNLMMYLDNEVFAELLDSVPGSQETIIDVGCGTGRHWPKLYARNPKRLIGFDSSEGMLRMLKLKYPEVETYLADSLKLEQIEDESADLLVSTLTIAHISDMPFAINEWARVLKPGGTMIITDYHPVALAKGGLRTFKSDGKLISIKNFAHPISAIISASPHLQLEKLIERKIDEGVKAFYEKQNALGVYESFKETEILFGVRMRKIT